MLEILYRVLHLNWFLKWFANSHIGCACRSKALRGLQVLLWNQLTMGATGPSGGFDIHNFFNKAPPSPYPPPQYSSHPPYPPNQYPPASNFPTNPASFSNMSGQNFQYSAPPPQQGSAPVYHYMHYPQEHALRPPSYSSAPFNQQPQPQFPPPGPLSSLQHSNPPHSSLPMSSIPQGSGGPSPTSTPPLDGARLMALLTTHSVGEASPNEEGSLPSLSGSQQTSTERSRSAHGSGPEVSVPPPAISPALPTAPPVNLAPSTVSARVSSGKQPKGRHLRGEHVVYDVDVRKPGEAQPQLEVSPITVYGSDPVLVVGRQIAVNKRYICYGLRAGTIRILNINTALRALLRGHTQVSPGPFAELSVPYRRLFVPAAPGLISSASYQERPLWSLILGKYFYRLVLINAWFFLNWLQRVTDMAFLAEDVHLLARYSGYSLLISPEKELAGNILTNCSYSNSIALVVLKI